MAAGNGVDPVIRRATITENGELIMVEKSATAEKMTEKTSNPPTQVASQASTQSPSGTSTPSGAPQGNLTPAAAKIVSTTETASESTERNLLNERGYLVNVVAVKLKERGMGDNMIKAASSALKDFVEHLQSQGKSLETMEFDDMPNFVKSRTSNPASQNWQSSALETAFRTLQDAGQKIAPFGRAYTRVERTKKEKVKMPAPTPIYAAQPDAAGRNEQNAAQVPQFPAAPPGATGFVLVGSPESARPMDVQLPAPIPVPVQTFAQPPAQRQTPRPQPKVNGLYRVHKMASGNTPGVPPGSKVYIGQYAQGDVDDIPEFISRYIRPQNGPFPGEPDAVYLVDVVDARGNKLRETMEIPIGAGAPGGQGQGMNPSPVYSGPHFPGYPQIPQIPPPAAPSGPNDRILDLMMRQLEANQRRADEMMTSAQGRGGMDAASLMQLMEMKRANDDLARQITDLRKNREEEDDLPSFRRLGRRPAREIDELPPMPPLRLPAPEPQRDQLGDLARTLAEKALAPQPTHDPLAHPLVAQMFAQIMAPKAAAGPDPFIMQALSEQRARSERLEAENRRLMDELRRPEKKGGLSELTDAINAMKVLREQVDPPQAPPGIVDVLMHAVENAPKIGEMFKGFAAAQMQAPQVGMDQAPGQQQQQPQQPAEQPRKQLTLPKAGRYAVKAMLEATTDQGVIDALFALLKAIYLDEDWRPLTLILQKRFNDADSMSELRAFVVTMVLNVGAKKLASDDGFIEKVATVLHTYYSVLYKQLNNGAEKTLTAEPSMATPLKRPEPTAPQVQPKPQAPAPEPVRNGLVELADGTIVDTTTAQRAYEDQRKQDHAAKEKTNHAPEPTQAPVTETRVIPDV